MFAIAVIKHEAIHVTPLKAIRYVMNGDKTEHCKFVTGINISENADEAYEEFAETFEYFSHERFYKQSLENNSEKQDDKFIKTNIRLHHYIQSFAPNEITLEQANKLGVEWAKKVFGDNRQILVCTHTDKAHIHNHILVSKYSLDGKVWYDNKTSLKKCRKISDELCREQGLNVIERPKKKSSLPYNEYLIKQSKKSWKYVLRCDIDNAIRNPYVKNIDDLKNELEVMEYEISGRKYLNIKPPNVKNRKPIQSLSLGDGYGIEELEFRIRYKDLFPVDGLSVGLQCDLGLYIRQSQYHLDGRKSHPNYNVSYYEARRACDTLTFVSANNIHGETDFARFVNNSDTAYKSLLKERDELSDKLKAAVKGPVVMINDVANLEDKIAKLDEKIKKAKAERDLAGDMYLYNREAIKTDYERMLENFKNGIEKPVVPFNQRISEMREWANDTIKKLAEQDRAQREYENNRYTR